MKRLHLLILRTFIGPFILVFFIVLFILLMQFLWRYIDELVGKGLEMKVIAELLLYTSASLVPMALPLAILMSSLMTFGNMGEYYELTAIKSSGISLQRIMSPLIVTIIFLSIGAFFFANDVLPYTNLKMRSLLYDVRKQRPEIQIMPGAFYGGVEGYGLRIERKNPQTNIMYEVKVYDHSENRGNTSVTVADSGSMIVTADKQNLIFTLYNGYSYIELQDERENRRDKSFPHQFVKFDERQMVIQLVGFDLERTDEDLFKSHYQMMNLSQLKSMEDSIEIEIDEKENLLQKSLLQGNYFPRKSNYNVKRAKIAHPIDTLKFDSYNENRAKKLVDSHVTIEVKYPVKQDIIYSDSTNLIKSGFFEKLTISEKDQVLEAALGHARTARTYVVNTLQTVDYKVKLLRRYEIEWQRKFTIAFACFVFLLIGAPLGAIIRKGGLGLPLVISTLLFIFYYIVSLTGEKVVRESILPAYQGMWIAPGAFFLVGLFLTYKATTDASILNFDTYSNFIRKYIGNRKQSLVETINKPEIYAEQRILKEDKLIATLGSFLDSIANLQNSLSARSNLWGFIVSIIGFNDSSEIILFERLYKNIFLSTTKSELFSDPVIHAKLSELPDFSHAKYIDIKWKLYLRIALLFVPPITLVIIIRHYILQLMLNIKLKTIYQITEDLLRIMKNMSDAV